MPRIEKPKAGDVLWLVPFSRHGTAHKVTVVSVGRKWVTVSNGRRFDMETGNGDSGGYSVRECVWPSEQAHADHMALVTAWQDFTRLTYRHSSEPPEGVTLSQVENAKRALFKNTADHSNLAHNEAS